MTEEKKPVVFLALPNYGGNCIQGHRKAILAVNNPRLNMIVCDFGTSILPHTFNALWCAALNANKKIKIDYFIMLHDDIMPHGNWIEDLVTIIKKTGSDQVSVAMRIKGDKGLSSTAVHDVDERGNPNPRRLLMREVLALPAIFSMEDITEKFGYKGTCLLTNTGLFICDFQKPWVPTINFYFQTYIDERDGTYIPIALSEDWNFSRDIHNGGGKCLCTTLIKADHFGQFGWSNTDPTGTWDEDKHHTGTEDKFRVSFDPL